MISVNLVKAKQNERKFHVYNLSYDKPQVMNSDNIYDTLLDTGALIHVVCNINFFSKLNTNLNYETSFLEMADAGVERIFFFLRPQKMDKNFLRAVPY